MFLYWLKQQSKVERILNPARQRAPADSFISSQMVKKKKTLYMLIFYLLVAIEHRLNLHLH